MERRCRPGAGWSTAVTLLFLTVACFLLPVSSLLVPTAAHAATISDRQMISLDDGGQAYVFKLGDYDKARDGDIYVLITSAAGRAVYRPEINAVEGSQWQGFWGVRFGADVSAGQIDVVVLKNPVTAPPPPTPSPPPPPPTAPPVTPPTTSAAVTTAPPAETPPSTGKWTLVDEKFEVFALKIEAEGEPKTGYNLSGAGKILLVGDFALTGFWNPSSPLEPIVFEGNNIFKRQMEEMRGEEIPKDWLVIPDKMRVTISLNPQWIENLKKGGSSSAGDVGEAIVSTGAMLMDQGGFDVKISFPMDIKIDLTRDPFKMEVNVFPLKGAEATINLAEEQVWDKPFKIIPVKFNTLEIGTAPGFTALMFAAEGNSDFLGNMEFDVDVTLSKGSKPELKINVESTENIVKSILKIYRAPASLSKILPGITLEKFFVHANLADVAVSGKLPSARLKLRVDYIRPFNVDIDVPSVNFTDPVGFATVVGEQIIKLATDLLSQLASNAVSIVTDEIANLAKDPIGTVVKLANTAIEIGKDIAGAVMDFVKDPLGSLKDLASGLADAALELGKHVVNAVIEKVTAIFTDPIGTVTKLAEAAWDKAKEIVNKVGEAVETVGKALASVGKTIAGWFTSHPTDEELAAQRAAARKLAAEKKLNDYYRTILQSDNSLGGLTGLKEAVLNDDLMTVSLLGVLGPGAGDKQPAYPFVTDFLKTVDVKIQKLAIDRYFRCMMSPIMMQLLPTDAFYNYGGSVAGLNHLKERANSDANLTANQKSAILNAIDARLNPKPVSAADAMAEIRNCFRLFLSGYDEVVLLALKDHVDGKKVEQSFLFPNVSNLSAANKVTIQKEIDAQIEKVKAAKGQMAFEGMTGWLEGNAGNAEALKNARATIADNASPEEKKYFKGAEYLTAEQRKKLNAHIDDLWSDLDADNSRIAMTSFRRKMYEMTVTNRKQSNDNDLLEWLKSQRNQLPGRPEYSAGQKTTLTNEIDAVIKDVRAALRLSAGKYMPEEEKKNLLDYIDALPGGDNAFTVFRNAMSAQIKSGGEKEEIVNWLKRLRKTVTDGTDENLPPTFRNLAKDFSADRKTRLTNEIDAVIEAVSPAPRNTLASGASLTAGQSRVSPDGSFTLIYQGDGNLVLYQGGSALWSSSTSGAGGKAVMQGDGNLVVYDKSEKDLWSSGTAGGGAFLVVQDDGNAVIYGASGSVLWSSRAAGATPATFANRMENALIESVLASYRVRFDRCATLNDLQKLKAAVFADNDVTVDVPGGRVGRSDAAKDFLKEIDQMIASPELLPAVIKKADAALVKYRSLLDRCDAVTGVRQLKGYVLADNDLSVDMADGGVRRPEKVEDFLNDLDKLIAAPERIPGVIKKVDAVLATYRPRLDQCDNLKDVQQLKAAVIAVNDMVVSVTGNSARRTDTVKAFLKEIDKLTPEVLRERRRINTLAALRKIIEMSDEKNLAVLMDHVAGKKADPRFPDVEILSTSEKDTIKKEIEKDIDGLVAWRAGEGEAVDGAISSYWDDRVKLQLMKNALENPDDAISPELKKSYEDLSLSICMSIHNLTAEKRKELIQKVDEKLNKSAKKIRAYIDEQTGSVTETRSPGEVEMAMEDLKNAKDKLNNSRFINPLAISEGDVADLTDDQKSTLLKEVAAAIITLEQKLKKMRVFIKMYLLAESTLDPVKLKELKNTLEGNTGDADYLAEEQRKNLLRDVIILQFRERMKSNMWDSAELKKLKNTLEGNAGDAASLTETQRKQLIKKIDEMLVEISLFAKPAAQQPSTKSPWQVFEEQIVSAADPVTLRELKRALEGGTGGTAVLSPDQRKQLGQKIDDKLKKIPPSAQPAAQQPSAKSPWQVFEEQIASTSDSAKLQELKSALGGNAAATATLSPDQRQQLRQKIDDKLKKIPPSAPPAAQQLPTKSPWQMFDDQIASTSDPVKLQELKTKLGGNTSDVATFSPDQRKQLSQKIDDKLKTIPPSAQPAAQQPPTKSPWQVFEELIASTSDPVKLKALIATIEGNAGPAGMLSPDQKKGLRQKIEDKQKAINAKPKNPSDELMTSITNAIQDKMEVIQKLKGERRVDMAKLYKTKDETMKMLINLQGLIDLKVKEYNDGTNKWSQDSVKILTSDQKNTLRKLINEKIGSLSK